jgi:hypothetical protein
MVSKAVLDQAKAFLCWDVFPNLTVQLIEMGKAVSYFHPPFNRCTILIYYEKRNPDFRAPLFLLFHEGGHYLQYQEMEKAEKEAEFWKIVHATTGAEKMDFEEKSWQRGRDLFEQFVGKNKLHPSLLSEYDLYARKCIESYRGT